MAKDNQGQARKMEIDGMQKAKRLNHNAVANTAPDSNDASRNDPELTSPAIGVPKSPGSHS
ncbi:hypothetical protein IGS68_28850 (plasmid) [Skermanella sp. TT6]|uniref:Uncharacterized protein n=1 Tax=Skermanella cutis TaxID=2775420 RepID=A0ABX7B8J0_9PROT|nr:hypothetical protein [Skermanella sp. TT6]QQP90652.1 hypothetical protein IGS68_05285 [Skermanella sp. TT6]QQP93152.1 hypothetical protein IGS68_28850 [Skermanella sp. TT6]